MLDSLLIPLDGSEFSEHTLPFARSVAKASGAQVHLAHVHVPHPPEDLLLNPQFQFEGVDMGEYDQEYRSEEKEYLEVVAARFEDQTGVPVVQTLLDGDVRESIQAYADEAHTDMILMSTHGRTGLSRFWLGSVADDLVRHLALPILLIPQVLFSEILLGANIDNAVPAVIEKVTITKWCYEALINAHKDIEFLVQLESVLMLAHTFNRNTFQQLIVGVIRSGVTRRSGPHQRNIH